MQQYSLPHKNNDNKIIFGFLACWTVLNIIQAYTLELHADEAYYWMYSRFLDWGYFDHPPMVALFIKAGDALMHNELGLRVVTIITSTLSIYLLWLILKKYNVAAWPFVWVTGGVFIFSLYGFTTTPDAPLSFFAILFYYIYQKYIGEDKWTLALALGVIVACMLYSKYHAVLLVAFTLASNIKLLRRPSFYLIVFLAAVLFAPHILWQVQHNYPSLNYHLYDRAASVYQPENTYLFIPGQLLMAGPVIGWFLFYKAFTIKIKDAFIRCLLVNCMGTVAFFFISTFRGEAQPHWTLIAFAPLAMLALISFKQSGALPRWFYKAAAINLTLIVVLRLCVVFAVPFVTRLGQIKSYYGFKDWAHAVKQKAGDAYVVMTDGFQNPAKYNYYNNELKAFSYDSRRYRRTQFDIWPLEEQMQHKRVFYVDDYLTPRTTDSIVVKAGKWYTEWVDDFRTYQKVQIESRIHSLTLKAGQKHDFDITITNPYPFKINFGDEGRKQQAFLVACYFKGDSVVYAHRAQASFKWINLKPKESTHYNFTMVAPRQKGQYQVMFSIRTTPFPGSANSRTIKLVVE